MQNKEASLWHVPVAVTLHFTATNHLIKLLVQTQPSFIFREWLEIYVSLFLGLKSGENHSVRLNKIKADAIQTADDALRKNCHQYQTER
jgi:hypothetical protein